MKKLVCLIMTFILIICPLSVFAYSATLSPSQVESGETFELVLNMDENIYLTNGHLKFDDGLFEYLSCNTSNVEIEVLDDDEIAWFYTELQNSPQGIRQIKFSFKAASVVQDTVGNFEIDDGIYIDTADTVYEDMDFIHPVTIKLKNTMTLPITGGTGIIVFLALGIFIMTISIVLIKRNKRTEK